MVRTWLVIALALTMVAGCSAEEPEAEPNSPEVDAGPDAEDEGDADTEGEDADAEDAPDAEDEGDVDADEPGTAHGFQPRMVLYDGDGEPVEAVVTSTAAKFPNNPQVGDVWYPEAPGARCASVFIEAENGQPIPLTVSLNTGDVSDCINYGEGVVRYPSDDCSGTPHTLVGNYSMVVVDGVPMRSVGQVVEAPATSYRVNGACISLSNPSLLLPLELLPSWMANAFPNPPYEVRLEF